MSNNSIIIAALIIFLLLILTSCNIPPEEKAPGTFWERTLAIGDASVYKRANATRICSDPVRVNCLTVY